MPAKLALVGHQEDLAGVFNDGVSYPDLVVVEIQQGAVRINGHKALPTDKVRDVGLSEKNAPAIAAFLRLIL